MDAANCHNYIFFFQIQLKQHTVGYKNCSLEEHFEGFLACLMIKQTTVNYVSRKKLNDLIVSSCAP